jgi:hypothetical protein
MRRARCVDADAVTPIRSRALGDAGVTTSEDSSRAASRPQARAHFVGRQTAHLDQLHATRIATSEGDVALRDREDPGEELDELGVRRTIDRRSRELHDQRLVALTHDAARARPRPGVNLEPDGAFARDDELHGPPLARAGDVVLASEVVALEGAEAASAIGVARALVRG